MIVLIISWNGIEEATRADINLTSPNFVQIVRHTDPRENAMEVQDSS